MAERVDLEQGSQEWIEFRKNYIGASEAPLIMGECEYNKTVLDLWKEKVGLDTTPFEETWAMRRGKELEPVALAMFNETMGFDLKPAVYIDERTGYISASYDGISECGTIACEIKVPSEAVHKEAQRGNVPRKYYGQVQQQIYVCDIKQMFYVSYHNGDLSIVLVNRDGDYIERLLVENKAFWYSVITLTPPERTEADIELRTDEEWCAISKKAMQYKDKYDEFRKIAQEYESAYKAELQKLATLSPKTSAQGGGVIFKRSYMKGAIDYKSIPELKEVDLEQYRKPSIEKLSIKKEKD